MDYADANFFIAQQLLQAFSAWLALLACEDSTLESGYNLYGLVAWMTVTSAIATYISTERGFVARIALSNVSPVSLSVLCKIHTVSNACILPQTNRRALDLGQSISLLHKS